MTNFYPKGSEWRRWDLHVHTPESLLLSDFPSWDIYFDALESAPAEVKAIGLTDYATIEGYKLALKAQRQKGRLSNFDLILPNLEFRVTPETKNNGALNLHLLVDPTNPDHVELIEDALTRLTFEYSDQKYPCTPIGLKKLGRENNNPSDDDRTAMREGCNQFKPAFSLFKDWYENEKWLRENSLVATSNKSSDGASGLSHDSGYRATRENVYRFCDFVFSGDPADRIYFLGKSIDDEATILKKYSGLIPCIHGSDAHNIKRLFKPDHDRFCWIKADTTFSGLRQVICEPEHRVYIGPSFNETRDHNNLLKSIQIDDPNGWFPSERIDFNSELVTIIGGKGSGKTALADLIAYGADAWQQTDASFIHKARNEIRGCNIELTWGGGKKQPCAVDAKQKSTDNASVRYLSQHFVEQLCSNDYSGTELTGEIERVIFHYLDETDKLGANSFDVLRDMRTKSIIARRNSFRSSLSQLHREIQKLRREVATKQEKLDKMSELAIEKGGLLKQMPEFGSVEEKETHERLSKAREQSQELITSITEKKRILQRIEDIESKVNHHNQEMNRLTDDLAESLVKVGVSTEEQPQIGRNPFSVMTSLLISRKIAINAEITELSGNEESETNVSDGLKTLSQVTNRIKQLEAIVSTDTAKKDRISQLQKRIFEIDRNSLILQQAINAIDSTVMANLHDKEEARNSQYLDLLRTFTDEKNELQSLYSPLSKRLSEGLDDEVKLDFSIKRSVDLKAWCRDGEALINQRKRGQYRTPGTLLEAAEQIIEPAWQSGVPEDILHSICQLRNSFDDQTEKWTLASQLRDGTPEAAFDEWLYSIEHIRLQYSIKFDGVELENLSSGTKGIVLLILYLQIDTQDRRPLIIDQPEENLDNDSVYRMLVQYFRTAKSRRQIILITHNPNLVVNTDAEQVIIAHYTRQPQDGETRISYDSGSLEDCASDGKTGIREQVCEILEGGEIAFQKREQKYSIRRRSL